MGLILLEGLDKTGKTTVAKQYAAQGYEVVHLSAPNPALFAPGYVGPSYLDQMVELIGSAATRHLLLDRSHYGELLWPQIYNRKPALNEDDFEILRELEDSVGVTRILMHDLNVEAHWQRCVENKEPLNKGQFLKARQLYEKIANKYGFEKKTLGDFVDVVARTSEPKLESASPSSVISSQAAAPSLKVVDTKPTEIQKLEKANAINDVLSKRIIKPKGLIYDHLEDEIRNFLKERLGRIFGETQQEAFSKEETEILKLFCQRLKNKETK